MAARPVELPGGAAAVRITISLGVVIGTATGTAAGHADGPPPVDALMDAADRALYAAKAAGRNAIEIGRDTAAA